MIQESEDFSSDEGKVNAASRLQRLPNVFSLADLCRTENMSYESAQMMLRRLTVRGWVKPAGPRAGYYYNLLRDHQAAQNHMLDVVQRLYPEAVVIGAAVLNAYQWTTQAPRQIDVAIIGRRTASIIDGVQWHRRTLSWLKAQEMQHAILREGESPFALRCLTPAAALADAQAHASTIWAPDSDDLYLPDDPEEGIQRLVPSHEAP